MTTAVGAAVPLQILVPQLMCFALNSSSIATNSTKTDSDKVLRDMKKRNNALSRQIERLHKSLEDATQRNVDLQNEVISLHGNTTRLKHQLQESKLAQMQVTGDTAADIVLEMAQLYEERDECKTKLDTTESQLNRTLSKYNTTKETLKITERLLNDTATKLFYTNAIVDALVPEREMLLTEAVALGNNSLIIPLVRLGTKATARDIYGYVPLEWTALLGDEEVARLLIEAGNSGNNVGVHYGDTVLHIAARNGFAEFTKLLLENGSNPNAENEYKNTPLHEAAFYGGTEVVKVLLDAGARVDPLNSLNATPLQLAAERGYLPVVQSLVQGGADRWVRNKAGRTPEEEAQRRGKQDVSWWLRQQT